MTAPENVAPAPETTGETRHQVPEAYRVLPPHSPWTYYRRNIWRVMPIGGAILISVFLIASIVTLLNSVDSTIVQHYGALRSFSILAPQYGADVPDPVIAKARSFPQVGKTLKVQPYFVFIKTVFGEMPVPIYGTNQEDMQFLAKATGNTLEPGGRWPALNEPEVVLPKVWADNFGVKVGQVFDPNSQNKNVPRLVSNQRLVGVLSGGSHIAVADMAYVRLSLTGTALLKPSYMLFPGKQDELAGLTANLKTLVDKPATYGFKPQDTQLLRAFTFEGLVRELRESLAFLYKFLTFADILVVGAVALLSGFLANIYFEQRLGEFGLLSALGFRREALVRRLILETAYLVVLAWVLGIGLTYSLFWLLDTQYMRPNGLILSPLDFSALWFTLPTPLVVAAASLATVLSRMYRLDPIEIMERR